MKKFLKSISADAKNLLFNFVGGIAWFLSLFMVIEKRPYQIIGLVALAIAGILLYFEVASDYFVKEDEMFTSHMKEAKAESLNRVVHGLMGYCILTTILSRFFGLNVEHDWRIMAFAVIGLAKLITCMYFRNLEKTGRYYY